VGILLLKPKYVYFVCYFDISMLIKDCYDLYFIKRHFHMSGITEEGLPALESVLSRERYSAWQEFLPSAPLLKTLGKQALFSDLLSSYVRWEKECENIFSWS
jgi:hypothetical protein